MYLNNTLNHFNGPAMNVSDTFLVSEFSMQKHEPVYGIILLISQRLASLEPVEHHVVLAPPGSNIASDCR